MFRIVIVGFLVYILYKLWTKSVRKKREAMSGGNAPHNITSGEMVSCARCGTFVLKSEALKMSHNYYCSENCKKS